MTDTSSPTQLPRLKTGVPRLDFILKGGYVRGGIYSFLGPPGSGKTILGNQCCFNHAKDGGRAVFVTLLAESHGRMLSNLRTLRFFDPAMVGTSIQYVSAFGVLNDKGLAGLSELIRQEVRQQQATLLVIDGIETAAAYSKGTLEFARFIRELQSWASLLDTTVMLLKSSLSPDSSDEPMVDGIIELGHKLVGPRAVREFTVHKFRGSDFLSGRHEVEISDQGIVVHPRTEVQFDKPPEHAEEERLRMAFGIESFDRIIRGGLLSGSTTMLVGAPGTGKTLLGLQFLAEGARLGQPGVYFGFYETPPRLVEKARSIGLDLEAAQKSGLIEIQWQPPLEHNLDSLAERLLERIRERNQPRMRLFIDGLAGFRGSAVYPERLGKFFAALTHELRNLDVTAVMTEETGLFQTSVELPNDEFATVVENVIYLRYVELRSQLYRLISVLKMRESTYDAAIREFRITDGGFVVADSFASAESILTGQARVAGDGGVLPPAGDGQKRAGKASRRKSAKQRKGRSPAKKRATGRKA